jgi:hypothetical protein
MKPYLIGFLLLFAAWSIPPARERTWDPALTRLEPVGEWLAMPVRRGLTRHQTKQLVRIIKSDRDQGRPVPDPHTFEAWLDRRFKDISTRTDSWGRKYYLEREAGTITVGSRGPSGERGTDDDIRTTEPF